MVQETREQSIHQLISERSELLLGVLNCLQQNKPSYKDGFTRPLLGMMMRQAAGMEELLDAYGANHNKKWRPFLN